MQSAWGWGGSGGKGRRKHTTCTTRTDGRAHGHVDEVMEQRRLDGCMREDGWAGGYMGGRVNG